MGWRWSGRRRSRPEVIDLRDVPAGATPRPPTSRRPVPALSSAQYAQLVARRQAELAREEARREVDALRRRHWSPDRIFEESRLGIDWWQHPLADPHAMLGILPGDTLADATAARRQIAKAVHPDRVAAGLERAVADRQMAAVNGAYDRLRRAYAPLPEVFEPAPRAGGAGPAPLQPG